jgi:hypothetical protein
VDLLINRTRDIAATTFFLTVGLAVGMVFAADLLHNQDGFIFFPVRRCRRSTDWCMLCVRLLYCISFTRYARW